VLITQAEFARLADVSRSAVKQAINNGLITAVVEQGGRILIDKNEGLKQYQANSRRQKKPKAPVPVPATLDESATGLELLSWGQAPVVKPDGSNTKQPTTPECSSRPSGTDGLPEYGKSRARTEFEKANLLELERKQKEGQLLEREDVERAWANTIGRVKSRILATASAAKQRIPHLDPEEVEILKDMLREALFELAAEGER
jgi:hypothetical protein